MSNPSTTSLDYFLWNYLAAQSCDHDEVTSETFDVLKHCYRSGRSVPDWLTASYVDYPRFERSVPRPHQWHEVYLASADRRGAALHFVVTHMAGRWGYRRWGKPAFFFESSDEAVLFRLKFG